MKIDFHLHSNASSDCASKPEDIIAWAHRKGLDGLALTNHDNINGFEEVHRLARMSGITLIPAVEISAGRGTHYLVYFTPEPPLPKNDLELIAEVHRRGGIVGVAHPYRSDTGLKYNQIIKNLYTEDEADTILNALDLIEGVNAKSPERDNGRAMQLAFAYPHLGIICGSDSHQAPTVGAVHLDIPSLSKFCAQEEMIDAIKNDRRVIVTLGELQHTKAEKALKNARENFRRSLVQIKPMVPPGLWKAGKVVYSRRAEQAAARRALKSVKA